MLDRWRSSSSTILLRRRLVKPQWKARFSPDSTRTSYAQNVPISCTGSRLAVQIATGDPQYPPHPRRAAQARVPYRSVFAGTKIPGRVTRRTHFY